MKAEKFSGISSRVVDKNPFWTYKIDEYLMPDLKIGKYYYADSRGSVYIIPLLENNKFILTRQVRYLNGKVSIEFPGGGNIDGIESIDNARKELFEETGHSARQIVQIGSFNPCAGLTNEICRVYLATGLKCETDKTSGDESEEINIFQADKSEIENLISTSQIWSGMTLAAWALFLQYRNQQ